MQAPSRCGMRFPALRQRECTAVGAHAGFIYENASTGGLVKGDTADRHIGNIVCDEHRTASSARKLGNGGLASFDQKWS